MNNIFFNNIGYFFQMVAIDSFCNALNFIKTYLNQDLTDNQIVTKSNSLYSGSLTDRYIYYFLVYLTYNTICTFFWLTDIQFLYICGFISILPPIINKIFDSKIFKMIRKKKELFVKIIIAKILSIIIKFYSKTYLQKKIKNFKHTELLYMLSDYKEAINSFSFVLKNFAIILALSYVKKYSTKTYYDIIKYVYNYKTGELLNSFSDNGAKDYLIDIVENKKWYEFKKTNTYNAMWHVYQMSIPDVDIFTVISDEINFMLIKIFSIWTFVSLFGSIYFVPLISLFLILYKYIKTKKGKIGDVIMIGASLPLCMLFDGTTFISASIIITSFVCQCLSRIVFNKVTRKLYKEIRGYTHNLISSVDIYDKITFIPSVSIIIYMSIINFLELHNILLLFNIILNYVTSSSRDTRKNILFGLIICSTYLSNFHINHVLFNTFIVFLIDHKLGGIQFNIKNIKTNTEIAINDLILYKDSQIYKIDIFKQIVFNVGRTIIRKNDFDYDLVQQLFENQKRPISNVIIEDFILGDDIIKNNNIEEKKNNSEDEIEKDGYNIVEDFLIKPKIVKHIVPGDGYNSISKKILILGDNDSNILTSDEYEEYYDSNNHNNDGMFGNRTGFFGNRPFY